MPNSDTRDGLHNKITKIIYQNERNFDDSSFSVKSQSFGGNVTTAKNYFMTAEALACIDDNGTQVEYAITSDGNGLKWTVAFGTPTDASQKSWADKYKDTKKTLSDADGWFKSALVNEPELSADLETVPKATSVVIDSSNDHLF